MRRTDFTASLRILFIYFRNVSNSCAVRLTGGYYYLSIFFFASCSGLLQVFFLQVVAAAGKADSKTVQNVAKINK